jgi:hypothetical protein
MSTRYEIFPAIKDRSIQLGAATETFDALGAHLNGRRITSTLGTPYQGGRGVASAVRAAYHYYATELGLGDAGAASIAKAFTNASGQYAYDE